MSKNVLIYGENVSLISELVSAARIVAEGGPITAAVVANDQLAREVASFGVKTLAISHSNLVPEDISAVASALADAAKDANADVVLLSADRRGRLLGGSLAQRIGAGFLTNVTNLATDDEITVSRNLLGGLLVAEQRAQTDRLVVGLAPGAAEPAQPSDTAGNVTVFTPDDVAASVKVTNVAQREQTSAKIDSADRLVVVGMGVEESDLDAVQDVAGKLGALVGCSKPVSTDRKWFSEDHVIGISGATCKPKLAILLGVSGQVQFYTGIRDAETIVAINKDDSAPIVGLADYVLVGDASQALSELEKTL